MMLTPYNLPAEFWAWFEQTTGLKARDTSNIVIRIETEEPVRMEVTSYVVTPDGTLVADGESIATILSRYELHKIEEPDES